MQLELVFSDIYSKKENNEDNSEDQYIEEFKQGNFSNLLMQTKYSAEEITDILLRSRDTIDKLKKSILKTMCAKVNYIEKDMNEEFKKRNSLSDNNIRKYNNKVREKLRQSFEKEDKEELKNRGLAKFYKYNNFYWKEYGGKSLNRKDKSNTISVVKSFHERHDKYIIKRKNHIQKCILKLLQSNISNFESIKEYYISIFNEKEFVDAINDMELTKNQRQKILPKKNNEEK